MNGINLDFYDDELLYSFLARYFERTGYINYISVAKDLFSNIHTRPDFEFLNKYTKETFDFITKNKSFGQMILDHTMFPYYCRYMPPERQKMAYGALSNMDNKWVDYISKPTNKGVLRHFRYCPICAEEDRKKYGETYWHRSHQMIGVDICPTHFCKLLDTDIVISANTSPCLITAEEKVVLKDAEYSENPIKKALAEYIYTVFKAPININENIRIGDYLHSKLPPRYFDRNMRNLRLLTNDFNEYYKCIITLEGWRIEKIFTGYNRRLHEICMLAMFLNISPSQLTENKNVSLNKPKRAKRKYINSKPGAKSKDWNRIDIETLPKVISLISQTKSGDKPTRITMGYVERMLNLPSKSLPKMPLSYNEILKNTETQDEFWIRKIAWAKEKLLRENKPLNWKHISDLTNIRRRDFDRLVIDI